MPDAEIYSSILQPSVTASRLGSGAAFAAEAPDLGKRVANGKLALG